MRRTFLMLTVLLLFLSLAAAQKTSVKRISVTSEAVAAPTNGKPYILDLSRAGTIYQVEPDVDLSSVQLRTSSGLAELGDLAKQAGRSGKLLIGQPQDLLSKDLSISSAAREVGYSCSSMVCKCSGFGDCFRMGKDRVCKGPTICDDTGCTCWKIFSRSVTTGTRSSQ